MTTEYDALAASYDAQLAAYEADLGFYVELAKEVGPLLKDHVLWRVP